ncbi:MAG: MliC family protein [Patescibacteria group bacterium]|nr:MliC family protein [Patescibacteria group bacterium]
MNRFAATMLALIIVVGGVFLWEYRDAPWLAPYLGSGAKQQQLVGTASYLCDQGKTISASYYQGTQGQPASTSASGMPPTPNGSVALTLSDGRSMTLPQTISGSGIRYASSGDAFVFWSKGNTAFVEEGASSQQTYANCIALSNIAGQEQWTAFASSTFGFSVKYPQGYTPASYVYQELGPGKDIKGVKFTIPASVATGTNLASDSYISVEQLPSVQPATTGVSGDCTADKFLDMGNGSHIQTVTDNGVDYSVASSTGAGAGNRYEEWAWAIPGTNPCLAVRYFIHYGVIQNYPPGMVQQFDEAALLKQFDGIRQSLVIGK